MTTPLTLPKPTLQPKPALQQQGTPTPQATPTAAGQVEKTTSPPPATPAPEPRPVEPLEEVVHSVEQAALDLTEPSRRDATLDLALFFSISVILVLWLVLRRIAHLSVRRKWLSALSGTRLNLLATTLMMTALAWLITSTVARAFSLTLPAGAILLVGVLLVTIPLLARDVLAGFTLGLRGQLAPGMRLSIASHEGYIERVGLSSVTLLGDDGGRIVLPTRELGLHPYELRAADRIARLSFSIPLPDWHEQDEEFIEKIRWICLVCPYRQPSSPITVTYDDEDKREVPELHISFQVSSENASTLARAFLERQLVVLLAEPTAHPLP